MASAGGPVDDGRPQHLVVPVCDRCGVILDADLVAFDQVLVCHDDETCWLAVQFQTVLSIDGQHSTGLTTATLPSHIGHLGADGGDEVSRPVRRSPLARRHRRPGRAGPDEPAG